MSLRNVAWMVVLVTVALMFLLLSPWAARRDTLLRRYGTLLEADALIRRHHVEQFEPDRLMHGALEGMLNSLDPYSSYLDADSYAAYKRRLAGEDVGIGIELAAVFNQPTVIAPIEGGPAAEAGVRPGDVILAVDGHSTDGLSVLAVEGLVAGEPGSVVELTLRRPAASAIVTLDMTRRNESNTFVRGLPDKPGAMTWIADEDSAIGYVRITAFRKPTIEQFDAAMQQIRSHNPRGLIIDLRNNPGGLVPEAVALVDRFVNEGVILRTFNRVGAEDRYAAKADGTDTKTLLAILINGSSASAAEIVSGSLQDHQRATIVGERSFGKGCIQYILELSDGQSALRLTTAYYMLPKGRLIHRSEHAVETDAWGILPDVRVEPGSGETDEQLEAAIRVLRSKLASN